MYPFYSQRQPHADRNASSAKSATSKLSAEERERRLKAMQANAQVNAGERAIRLEERRKENAREAVLLMEKAKAAKASYGTLRYASIFACLLDYFTNFIHICKYLFSLNIHTYCMFSSIKLLVQVYAYQNLFNTVTCILKSYLLL